MLEMMTHQKHIGKECLLSALAMATGEEYHLLRRRKVTQGWRALMRHYPRGNTPWGFWKEKGNQLMRDMGFEEFTYKTYAARQDKLDLRKVRGSGILIVEWADGGGTHALAFHEGIVYDGGAHRPYPLHDWLVIMERSHGGVEGWSRYRRVTT